jgi:hypothetical protein
MESLVLDVAVALQVPSPHSERSVQGPAARDARLPAAAAIAVKQIGKLPREPASPGDIVALMPPGSVVPWMRSGVSVPAGDSAARPPDPQMLLIAPRGALEESTP